jgi:HlyD family secretion protein
LNIIMAEEKRGGWIIWLIVLGVLGGLTAGGGYYFKHQQPEPPDFQTVTIDRGDLTQAVTAGGALNPVKNVQVGCQVSGQIAKLYVDYNSPVKQGQVIAEIDPSTYKAAEQQAAADLDNSRANLELEAVEARRANSLFTNQLISASDYDTAIATLHEAQATVKIKEATLATAVANLGFCRVFSPVDGVVISRAVDVGQTVASSFSTPTLFQIAGDLTKMQIDTSIAEADIGSIVEGQAVEFKVDAYPYRTFQGAVLQVRNAPITNNNVVIYDTIIGVTNADYKLKPGMTAMVSIVITQRENVLKIPNSALRFHPLDSWLAQTNPPPGQVAAKTAGNDGGPHNFSAPPRRREGPPSAHTVFRLDANKKLEAVPIQTGISDGLTTEVTAGLKDGDVVVSGSSGGEPLSATGSNPLGGGFGRR